MHARALVTKLKCASKKSVFFSKIKNWYFCLFFRARKTNSFRRPGGFCWPIGVTAALLGRLLPSDGHKLVKTILEILAQKCPRSSTFWQDGFF
jgi:hypothetical protein